MSGVSLPSRHSESSIAVPDVSTTANQNARDDSRPSEEKTPPLSALTTFDGKETEDLCQTTGRLSIVDIRKTEKSLEIGSKLDPPRGKWPVFLMMMNQSAANKQ
ncbi:hypothetical protein PMAYCL1PPCAC_25593 [Pristionchus mayeri]|uniref:Uncharacterized protein n=1 Tax=Pristionchus mayeri TaxID=1317129 RepID=A0AAN5D2I6_9BILA|nr:hypothetical protein PMAYCL1PPCAC_25593 [Pristionchus mayeri]